MEEQLISFATSKLAKEKGFNEYHKQNSCKKGIEKVHLTYQSLLQKWLRDKHNIHIYIKPYIDEELNQILYEDFIIKFENNDLDFNEFSSFTFEHTYEESLEIALLTALNTI